MNYSAVKRLTECLLLAGVLAGSTGCTALIHAMAQPDATAQNGGAGAGAQAEEKAVPEAKQIKEAKLEVEGGATAYCQGGDPPKLRLSITRTSGKKDAFVFGDGRNAESVFGMFAWTSNVGTIGEDGTLDTTAASPKAAEQDLEVSAKLKKNESVSAKLTLTPDFKCSRTADFRGAAGKEGEFGQTGQSGEVSLRERRKGGSGGNGGPGRPGGNGGDALPVEVVATFIQSEKHGKLALVRVQQVGGPKKGYYLLDPEAAVLTVDASGGAGGTGGQGGSGGDGYGGYMESTSGECCNGDGGDGGSGGDGGPGGNGGKGAAVVVKIDTKAKGLKERLKVVNGAGAAGAPGSGGSAGNYGQGGNGSQGARGSDGHAGVVGHTGTVPGKPGAAGPAPKFTTEAVAKSVAEGG